MAYNPETEKFYQAQSTVVDSTPDGDTVKEGFVDRLTPALAGVYADINLLKTNGMIGMGVPATESGRGIGRVATAAEVAAKKTSGSAPAFVTPENMTEGMKLNNTVTSTSTTEAATANAVKMAYDKATSAESAAGSAQSAVGAAAPRPQTGSGVGQFVRVWATGSYSLPSGGTWAWWLALGYGRESSNNERWAWQDTWCGVSSGGTTVWSPGGGSQATGWVWRVA